ncbi:MAG: hypothetical protein ACJAWL_001275 [Motiliproteus sp.]|jgi:hypothetical protein
MKGIISIIVLLGLVNISGCATTAPTFGDRVLADGESKIEISRLWEQGKKETTEGDKKIKNGRGIVDKGRSYLREGERLIASGNVDVRTNRQEYQSVSKASQGIGSGTVALERVARLKKIAKNWEEGEDAIAEGKKIVRRGNENIAAGELEISNGQQLLVRGRDKMLDAESHYQDKTQ